MDVVAARNLAELAQTGESTRLSIRQTELNHIASMPPSGTPPPPDATPTFRQWFFANWQSLSLLGGAWATVLILLAVIYGTVTSSISDVRQAVSDLSKEFNQANASANSVTSAIKDASEAVKLWRETHDQLIGVAIPELKQHTGQLNDIQSTLKGIVTTLGSVTENQKNMATDLTHVRSDLNDVRQKLLLPIRPRD